MDRTADIAISAGLLILSGVLHFVMAQTRNGRLDRNAAVGIRTKATMSTEVAWHAGHRAAAPWLLGAAIAGYGSGILAVVISLGIGTAENRTPAPIIIALSGYVVVLVVMLIAVSEANRSARRTIGSASSNK
ncbi:SdpI family protein [Micromonospora lupini]|uniref:SdpI family protein n=1 Tax=Micromonospora lupini TaxID=285679 RepID=UPI00225689E0|nr:SdpI family protein [Micromonospora lupini]MCX5069002.1 SdpI family protein [Micromonospora lupini]